MKIETQCCTLEQAKKLSELGIEQETEHFYFEYIFQGNLVCTFNYTPSQYTVLNQFAAFTVAELFVMLDENLIVAENDCHTLNVKLADRLINRLSVSKDLTATEVNNRLINS